MSDGLLRAYPLGELRPTPAVGSGAGRPPCARCGCKLSRYTPWSDRYCWACDQALQDERELTLPMFQPEYTEDQLDIFDPAEPPPPKPRGKLTREEKAKSRKYELCQCGRDYKKKGSIACAACRVERITSPPGSYSSRTCGRCGGPKKYGAKTCRDCHWEERRAAWRSSPSSTDRAA